VYAVRGNVDTKPPLIELPEKLVVSINGAEVLLLHRLKDATPSDSTRIVVAGHSHRPVIEETERILYLNPGAAGKQGFHRERTAMLLNLDDSPLATLIRLGPRSDGRFALNRHRPNVAGRRIA
jgi:putative phosphoesterase